MNSFARIAVSAILASSASVLLSCAKSGEIQLQGTNPDQPTGDGNSQRDPDGSGGNKGDTGGGTDNPNPPNPDDQTPKEPAKRFAVLCRDHALHSLVLVESDDLRQKNGKFLTLVTKAQPSTGFDDIKNEITDIRFPLGVGSGGPGRLYAFLIGRKGTEASAGAQRLYFAAIDSVYKIGVVQDMGAPIFAGPEATARAKRYGFTLHPYGFSDDGTMIVAPKSGGYTINDPASNQDIGRIDWAPSRHTNPVLFTKLGVIVAQTYDGHFGLRAARYVRSASGALSFTAVSVPGSEGYSQTTPVMWDEHTLAWLETKANSAGGAASSGARVVRWNVETGKVVRLSLGLPKSGTLNGQVAHWNRNGKNLAVVLFESFKSAAKVDRAEAIAFDLSGDAAVIASRAPYPEDSVKEMQRVQNTGVTQSQGLFSGSDGRTVMMVVPSRYLSQVYKMGSEFLTAMTVQPCEQAGMSPDLE